MGCDIHMYTERFCTKKNRWVTADEWELDPWRIEDWAFEHGSVPSQRSIRDHCRVVSYGVMDERDYLVFTILAGVRSYDAESVPPMSEPRGMPEDACKEIKLACAQWDGDGHSHSYFTLAELNTHMARSFTVRVAAVGKSFIDWVATPLDRREKLPSEWWFGSGEDVFNMDTIIDFPAAQLLVKAAEHDPSVLPESKYARTLFQYEFNATYEDLRPKIRTVLMHHLEQVSNGDPNHARCVFWFDN